MKVVKITFNEVLGKALYPIKLIKDFTDFGLLEAKNYFERIIKETEIGYVGCEIDSQHYNILMMLLMNKVVSFEIESVVSCKVVKESKRVIAKKSKEYEEALAWFKSLHPKKQALINILIREI